MTTHPIDPRRGSTSSAHRRAAGALWLIPFLLLPLVPGAIAVAVGFSPFGVFWTTVWTALAVGTAAVLLTAS